VALDFEAPAKFSLSGLVGIAAGLKSAVVAGVALRAGSLVLATVQNKAGVSVAYAQPDAAKSTIAIVLNKAVPSASPARVACFVVS
jgi:hypothetical protein